MKAVYSGLKEVFQLSDDAINIRLFAHEPHRFAIQPTKNKSETYAQAGCDADLGYHSGV